jgi:hypothetical protein
MADIYANLVLARLDANPPPGWQQTGADLDAYYRSRKQAVDRGHYRQGFTLRTRLTSDGLYEYADVFLLDVRRAMGDAAFRTAARDLYLASDFGRYVLREKRIEDVFLEHTAAGDRDQVMALFNESIWGDNGEQYRALQDQ